jgi:5'-nucleotidase
MRILLTNDDGIHAPGLKTLEAIAAQLSDDVFVVAPETDQSGVAHSLSLSDPLRLREISPKHYAVQGTPTDCVIMGVRHILREHRPDLILSGVNRGQNVAEDVTYSGTIAAGIEAALLGVPAIALSQAFWGPDGDKSLYWDCAKTHGIGLIRQILKSGIAPGTLINVNFPPCPPDQVTGVAIAAQGRRDADLMRIEERRDGRGNPYYWLMFQKGDFTPGEGTDLAALAARKIAVTPLRPDLTDGAELLRYAEAFA